MPAASAGLATPPRDVIDRDDSGDAASWDMPAAGIPSKLGGVRILRQLGAGGMGQVYLGHHPILAKDVAVKVLINRHDEDDRFLNEARLAASVDHENIVRIFHAGCESGVRFLVMELVRGPTLRQRAQERGPLPWQEAAGYILQAARGLAAVHRQGIIHRDIKPSNMLLDESDHLKISDLGIARAMLGPSQGTMTGALIGTPSYMAPEQSYHPHCVTPAADVYALGVSLYSLIAGSNPFSGLSLAELVLAHRDQPVPDLRQSLPALPPAITQLTARMMAKDAAQRPADGGAVVIELERLLGLATASTSIPALTPSASPQATTAGPGRRRWWIAGLIGTILVGSVLLGMAEPAHATSAAPAAGPAIIAAAAIQPADPWPTPPRAVFVLGDRLPAAVLDAIDGACLASRLPVIERQRVDILLREHDLVAGARIDPATAGRIGKLVGGHVAVFATALDEAIAIRTVLVETGEVVASRVVKTDGAAAATTAGIAAATAALPVHARIAADGSLAAGARHGVQVGDRFSLHQIADGPAIATATVTSVDRDHASITVDPLGTASAGTLALRAVP